MKRRVFVTAVLAVVVTAGAVLAGASVPRWRLQPRFSTGFAPSAVADGGRVVGTQANRGVALIWNGAGWAMAQSGLVPSAFTRCSSSGEWVVGRSGANDLTLWRHGSVAATFSGDYFAEAVNDDGIVACWRLWQTADGPLAVPARASVAGVIEAPVAANVAATVVGVGNDGAVYWWTVELPTGANVRHWRMDSAGVTQVVPVPAEFVLRGLGVTPIGSRQAILLGSYRGRAALVRVDSGGNYAPVEESGVRGAWLLANARWLVGVELGRQGGLKRGMAARNRSGAKVFDLAELAGVRKRVVPLALSGDSHLLVAYGQPDETGVAPGRLLAPR